MLKRKLILLVLSLVASGCAPSVSDCPVAVLPNDYVDNYMLESPQGVKDWYGQMLTINCLLEGGSVKECSGK